MNEEDDAPVYDRPMIRLATGEIVPAPDWFINPEVKNISKKRYKVYKMADGTSRAFKSYQSFVKEEKKILKSFNMI